MSDLESKADKLSMKRALCYAPLVAVVLSVVDKDNKELEKDIRYGVVLFILFVVSFMIGSFIGLGGLVLIIYLGISGFFAYKAYNKQEVNASILDKTFEGLKEQTDNIGSGASTSTGTQKKNNDEF